MARYRLLPEWPFGKIGGSDTEAEALADLIADLVAEGSLGGSTPGYATTTTSGLIQLASQAQVDAETSTDRAVTPSTLATYVAAELAGVGGGSGTTRNTHTHSASGTLSIPRASADQDTRVVINANVTGFTDNLSDRDYHHYTLVNGTAADYTVDLSSIKDWGSIANNLNSSLNMYQGTVATLLLRKIEGVVYGTLDVIVPGAQQAGAWSVTWTSNNAHDTTGVDATGGTATFGAGIVAGTSAISYDDGSASVPVMRAIPNNYTDAAAAVTNDSYVEFPLTGTNLDAATVTFDTRKGGASDPRGWELRSSADSYASTLGTGTSADDASYGGHTVDVSSVAATTNLTFRLYLYTPSSGSVIYVDNFRVQAA